MRNLSSWSKTITNNHVGQSDTQPEPATVQATVEKRVVRFVEPEPEKTAVNTERRTVRFAEVLETGAESRTVKFVEPPASPERRIIYRDSLKTPSKVHKITSAARRQQATLPTACASVPPLIDLETPPQSPQAPPTPPASPVSPAFILPTTPPPANSGTRSPSPGIEDLAPEVWIEFSEDEEPADGVLEEGDSDLKIVKVESLHGKEDGEFI